MLEFGRKLKEVEADVETMEKLVEINLNSIVSDLKSSVNKSDTDRTEQYVKVKIALKISKPSDIMVQDEQLCKYTIYNPETRNVGVLNPHATEFNPCYNPHT